MRGDGADLYVAGAGVLGLTTALAARRRHPEWSIVVADRGAAGAGASRHSAAVAAPYGTSAAHRALVARSLRCFREGALAPFARRLPALVIAPRMQLPALQERIVAGGLREAAGAELAPVLEALGGLVLGGDEVVLTAPDGILTVDVPALVECALAPRSGVEARFGDAVAAIERDGRGYLIRTERGSVTSAARVVIATGPWRPPAVTGASGPVGFAAKRVAALHLAATPPPAAVFWPAADCFLLPDRDRLLFSFPRRRWLEPDSDPAAAFGEADLREGMAALANLGVPLAGAVAGGRAHADAYAGDRLPRVETDGARLAWLWGGSGSGVALAPALAERALAAVSGADL